MDSILHKLMCISIITSAVFYIIDQTKDKDFLGLSEGRKIGNLIGTANAMGSVLYYLDTDNNMKTAEYICSIKNGSQVETQMNAQIFNNEQRPITRMPLSKWRDMSDTFQKVMERF